MRRIGSLVLFLNRMSSRTLGKWLAWFGSHTGWPLRKRGWEPANLLILVQQAVWTAAWGCRGANPARVATDTNTDLNLCRIGPSKSSAPVQSIDVTFPCL